MNRAIHGLSRLACPPADRRWVDALFAEGEQIDSARERLGWLVGALGFVVNRNAVRFAAAFSPMSLVMMLATIAFAVLAVIEYEGLAFEDDWYGVIATLLGLSFLAVVARRIRRGDLEPRL